MAVGQQLLQVTPATLVIEHVAQPKAEGPPRVLSKKPNNCVALDLHCVQALCSAARTSSSKVTPSGSCPLTEALH